VSLDQTSLLVIGAGLAGSAVAATFAQRHWRVAVLDAASEPAQGASSLPVGLMAPMISREDTAAARLTREGVSATLAECARLTQLQSAGALREGIDWQACEVIQHSLPGTPRSRLAPPPDWPEHNPWIRAHPSGHSDRGASQDWLHLQAAWIKPAALVRAWLATPGIEFIGHAAVQRLKRDESTWQAQDASGRVIASAAHIVIAAATGTSALLSSIDELDGATLPALNPVAGQVAYAPWTPEMQATLPQGQPQSKPHNGNGHFIPHVPTPQGVIWLSGSTYEHTPLGDAAQRSELGIAANIERAASLLPAELGALIAQQRDRREIRAWQSTRCTSPSRLPVVQTLAPGLHICTAMGSRGLTFAWLSAQTLAQRMSN
jgi:tRNA 5-methylaminomethyl-2-thiouridine biosynthesis bifunctional protein